jgi:hypothetical protein
MKSVVFGVAGAVQLDACLFFRSDRHCDSRGCYGEAVGDVLSGIIEIGRCGAGERRGYLALALHVELAFFGIETQRRVRLGSFGVFAGDGFHLRSGRRRRSCGLRRRLLLFEQRY